MRSLHVLMICALALAGCATSKKQEHWLTSRVVQKQPADRAPSVASQQIACPTGYHMRTNQNGSACAPKGESEVDATFKPRQCGEYMVFDYYTDMFPDPSAPDTLLCLLPARNEDGKIRIDRAIAPSKRTPAEFDQFYAFLREYLHGHPNPKETKAHLRYHAYRGLADQLGKTPSDTLIENSRSRALAAEPWFEQTVTDDIQHCDGDLARAAMRIAVYFTRRGALTSIVRVQRFRDTRLPEEVRLALLHGWLNAIAGMHQDDRAEGARIWSPVLADLERSDPSPLIRQAVPLYRDMLVNSPCCGQIHWPNAKPAPTDAQGIIRMELSPLGKIYEPEDAWPLPEPDEGGMHRGTCPPVS